MKKLLWSKWFIPLILALFVFVPFVDAGSIPLFGSKQPGGILVFTDQTQSTGSIYFVDDSGTNGAGYGVNPNAPFATLDYAIGKCTAGVNDRIYLMPGHAETVTAAITADVAGVSIYGLGTGRNMPVITGNGAIDAITVTAADVSIVNVEFGIPGTDAQTSDINVAAGNCSIINTIHHGSTTSNNKVDIITITATGHDCLIDGARIYNDTVEIVGAIVLEGACKRAEIRNCFVFDSVGITNGAISDEATALGVYIHHNIFGNGKADTVVAEFGNNTTGVFSHNFINGRHTTLASNYSAGTGMAFHQNRVVEQAALNGAILPAADTD